MMLPTIFRFIWQSGFREEHFLEINQSETRIAFGGIPRMLPTKFQSIWPSGFRGDHFLEINVRKQELLLVVMFNNI
jgi:hypothetical protein